MPQPQSQHYLTLDGIRGIAAVIVMTRHLPDMFGYQTFPRCYLAVDLFFVLSGFVIANAYSARLASGMRLGAFMALRFIRFFPLYSLAFGFALVSLALELALPGARAWTTLSLASAVAFGALLLPAPFSPASALFPLNLPCWSLGFELAVNLFYAAIHRWLGTRTLLVVIGVSALALLRYGHYYGNMNFGDGWDGLGAGAARVGYSFFAGVLIWRFRKARRPSTFGAMLAGALAATALLVRVGPMPFDFIMVFAGFPLLVWFAAQVEPAGRAAAVFLKLGLASYGLYVIHTPVGQIVERLAHLAGTPIPMPWLGLLFIPAVTFGVLWLDARYDLPLRRRLNRAASAQPR